jgi:putative ABC transport system ATP-binding protein
VSEAPIVVDHVSHHYGEGDLRLQVLFDVCAEIRSGEIVILTGPSGSGKTTLLTLIGALRSTQQGSLRVLGRELRGAPEQTLAAVRRRIGYVFQAHNLLDALTIRQNVQMSLELHGELAEDDVAGRALEALQAVGLADRAAARPNQLSGGQRQRVAIARALAARPEIVLADEPTASLDRKTGRGVMEMLERLARQERVTVVLVTHDSRVLDVADRILALDDGRLTSLMRSVASGTRHAMRTLARDLRGGELARRLERLDAEGFGALLDEVTEETRELLEVMEVAQSDAFESVLEQVVGAFSAVLCRLFEARRVGLFFLDEDANELWSFSACEHGGPQEVRVPAGWGLLGEALRSGLVQASPSGGASGGAGADAEPGSVLAVPVRDSGGRAFAVVELIRDPDRPFERLDEERIAEFTRSLGLLLESWWRMSCACHKSGVGRSACGCGPRALGARPAGT